MSIFELINKNIYTLSEDVHSLMSDMAELKAMLTAPEQPNVRGDEGEKISK